MSDGRRTDGEDDAAGSDRWPHEPDDPGEVDPQSVGPRVDVPEPDVPSAPDYSSVDVPADLATAFWTTVALVKLGMLAVAVGTLLLVFLGDLRRGGGFVLVGLVAFALAYRRYRRYQARNRDRDGDDGEDPPGDVDGGHGPDVGSEEREPRSRGERDRTT